MAKLISLREIAETMEVSSDECVSYLDPDTGEIITVTEEERQLAERRSRGGDSTSANLSSLFRLARLFRRDARIPLAGLSV